MPAPEPEPDPPPVVPDGLSARLGVYVRPSPDVAGSWEWSITLDGVDVRHGTVTSENEARATVMSVAREIDAAEFSWQSVK